jgi:sortase B
MDISFVALVGALIYLAVYYVNYRKEIKTENENYSYIEEAKNVPIEDQPAAWEEIKARYPDVEFPEGMNYAFAQVYALNQDTVGYLTIKETNAAGEEAFRIRTVLLQSKAENGDYYLRHNFYKKTSRYGHPYVKINCSMGPEGLSKNTIVYGHNTHDHLIFNRLEDYMTKDGYIGAPVITLDTLYGTTKWKIFAVMLTNADPADDNGRLFEYLDADYSSESAFLDKMEQIKKRSMIHTGVDVQAGDKTLMLYTCHRNSFDSGRLVIVARQLREGESETINTSQVYECKNTAIFPAAYYTGSRKNIETTTEPTTQQRAAQPTQPAPTEPTEADPTEPSGDGGASEEPTQAPPVSEFEPPASEPDTEENGEPGEN